MFYNLTALLVTWTYTFGKTPFIRCVHLLSVNYTLVKVIKIFQAQTDLQFRTTFAQNMWKPILYKSNLKLLHKIRGSSHNLISLSTQYLGFLYSNSKKKNLQVIKYEATQNTLHKMSWSFKPRWVQMIIGIMMTVRITDITIQESYNSFPL